MARRAARRARVEWRRRQLSASLAAVQGLCSETTALYKKIIVQANQSDGDAGHVTLSERRRRHRLQDNHYATQLMSDSRGPR